MYFIERVSRIKQAEDDRTRDADADELYIPVVMSNLTPCFENITAMQHCNILMWNLSNDTSAYLT